MKKVNKLFLLSTLCITLLAGCKSTKAREHTTITIMTANSNGSIYQFGQDLASLWNHDLSYVTATSYETEGGLENLQALESNEGNIGFAVTSIAYEAYTGTGPFEQKANDKLRVIAGLYYNPNQLVVTKDSGIQSLDDLVGKRFSPGTIGSTTVTEAKNHLSTDEIDMYEDCQILNTSFTDSIKLMKQGDLDAAWIMAGIGNSAVMQMTQEANATLINLSDSTIASLMNTYPWYVKYIIPAGTYYNQTEDVQTTAIKLVLLTTADVKEEVVYDLTKEFWENIEQFNNSSPSLQSISVAGAITDLSNLPLHDGALKYYKEIGILK